MRMLKKSSIVLVVLVGLLGVSSVALAEHEDGHPEDTTISFGYDAENHFLAINIHPDDVDECVLENGAFETTYTEEEDGIYGVELDVPEICSVKGVVVGGPNGQINHGQFMKAVKSLFDIKGHGCVMRYLAQSDLGKGDTQIRTSDVDDAWEIGDGGEIEFETLEADCKRGKKEKGRPDSPGKSADAPGKTRP